MCAWCEREGRPGFIGIREPVEDTGITHGICTRHKLIMLSRLPSVSFPGIDRLYIVPRNQPTLYRHLRETLSPVPGIEVIVDRRVGQRRAQADRGQRCGERRQADRRQRNVEAHSLGYTVVRFLHQPA
jgi:hypothetical protein